ncbi:MAG TPA: DUF72 domain-containing protein [Rhizomicrobium sp.]|jgi:uncharacterized protein YecE (DUF72 family)
MSIYVGVGGWVFEAWRDNFYPAKLPQKRELEYASTHLTAIEVNGTYYGSQTPKSFRRWHDETPAGFVFTVKGPRFATNRRVLAEAGESIGKFFDSGVSELKDKLGPVNWQFMATKQFDPTDFEAFLDLLPKKIDGRAIRHAVEVRHESFKDTAFIGMCRDRGVGVIFSADGDFPTIADVTADFVYVRIMGTQAKEKLGYSKAMIAKWAERAQRWEKGESPDLALLAPAAPKKKRDVFFFVISGAKERNPAAAQALIAELG